MKSTLVLTLDADNVTFLEHLSDEIFHKDPDTLINSLLRQERERLNLPERHISQDYLDQLIDEFTHRLIPAAG